jgi:hypothetical protein
MKRSIVVVITVLVVVSGCAMSPSGAGRATSPPPLAGSWSGTITGLDMATAADVAAMPARLTLAPDGRWTLSSPGGFTASGASRATKNGVLLEGTVTAGDPMTVGRQVVLRLQPRGGDALYGGGETFFLGHRVDSEIRLRRAA